MTQPFTRTRITWIAYILLALYAYFLNIFGPITPFLKDEFHLSFTVSSLHYSAFAVGMLVVGLAGHLVIDRAGRELALALGAAGLGTGALLLVLGRAPAVTIAAAFLMGCVGSLILAVVPAALSEEHGELRAIAISEANVLSSLVSTAAPLLVGWLARALVGWRWALVAAALLSIAAGLYLARVRVARVRVARVRVARVRAGRDSRERPQAGRAGEGPSRSAPARGGLPRLFWFFWTCIVLAVSIEFCMVGWSADYMERELGMARAAAAQTVSLFLGGMIAGRYAISRVLRSLKPRAVVIASLLVGLCGFLLFWSTSHAVVGMAGLALAGLGTAGLYPLLLSMAIAAAGENEAQAGARATLASGAAILALPLTLGRLADLAGLKAAFAIVAVLFAALLVMALAAGRVEAARKPACAVE
jgi:fucose permease